MQVTVVNDGVMRVFDVHGPKITEVASVTVGEGRKADDIVRMAVAVASMLPSTNGTSSTPAKPKPKPKAKPITGEVAVSKNAMMAVGLQNLGRLSAVAEIRGETQRILGNPGFALQPNNLVACKAARPVPTADGLRYQLTEKGRAMADEARPKMVDFYGPRVSPVERVNPVSPASSNI